ncbi:MAG: hypothetical protein R3C41_00610 [Calditrichia bacterium]
MPRCRSSSFRNFDSAASKTLSSNGGGVIFTGGLDFRATGTARGLGAGCVWVLGADSSIASPRLFSSLPSMVAISSAARSAWGEFG